MAGGGEAEVEPDREDVADAALLEHAPQFAAASVDLVAGRPGRAQPGVQRASGLVAGDLALGREGVPSVEPGRAHARRGR